MAKAKKAAKKKSAARFYVICTDKRGVFLGKLAETPLGPDVVIEPTNVRQCIYWTSAVRGVMGLASEGPGDGCRIGPEQTSVKMCGVHCYIPVTDAALSRWKAAPWA